MSNVFECLSSSNVKKRSADMQSHEYVYFFEVKTTSYYLQNAGINLFLRYRILISIDLLIDLSKIHSKKHIISKTYFSLMIVNSTSVQLCRKKYNAQENSFSCEFLCGWHNLLSNMYVYCITTYNIYPVYFIINLWHPYIRRTNKLTENMWQNIKLHSSAVFYFSNIC